MSQKQIARQRRETHKERKSKTIIRERELQKRLACGRTKLRGDYLLIDHTNKFVPGTQVAELGGHLESAETKGRAA